MSAIGGIVDFNSKEVDFSALNTMRFSMSLRGRRRSTAFLHRGVGMFFNCSYDEVRLKNDEYYQPNICERRGRVTSLCIDSESILPSAAVEKYFVYGIDFLGCFGADFAVSLYDEDRDILILSRDRCGRKPLFYRVYNNKIFFSSEVKGIVDGIGEKIFIDRNALQFHLTSPIGAYRASDIYSDIEEVRAGECVIFSKFGLSKFFYRDKRDERRSVTKKSTRSFDEKTVSLYYRFNSEKLGEYLGDALTAFDYPQFDCHLPTVMDTMEKCAQGGRYRIRFEDAIRRQSLTYAREREDRISALYGIYATGTFTKSNMMIDKNYLDLLYFSLRERFFSLNESEKSSLICVFGKQRFDGLERFLEDDTKKEDTEQSVRILAMLCQTADWLESKNICFGKNGQTVDIF